MAGFEWDMMYSVLKNKIGTVSPDLSVGRYSTTKPAKFPYVDISLGDNSGGAYDLCGAEGTQNPMIIIDVYGSGSSADSDAYTASMVVRNIMVGYAFKCLSGPIKGASTDSTISRWTARYQRLFGSGDELNTLN